MGFAFKTGYIGPYAVTVGQAYSGDTQKFRYKVPPSKDNIAQGTFVLEGRILASWSSGSSKDQIFETGANLSTDRQYLKKVLTLNEDLTLTALTNCAYVCASAVGIEQKVHFERLRLEAGEEIAIPRYELLLMTADSSLTINGGATRSGTRLVYARTNELVLKAGAACTLGTLSMRG